MAVELMSQAEYARHRGVSQEAVRRAIAAGRITTIDNDGKTAVDPEVADIQWAKNTRITHTSLAAAPELKQPPSEIAPDAPRPISLPESQLYDIQAARAKREHHEANLADLRERKAAGVLVERYKVEKAAADVSAVVKGGLEQLPGKLATQLAAESDVSAIRQMLTSATAEVLANMADALERMTVTATPEPTDA